MGLDLFPKSGTLPPAQMERLFATYLIETPLAVEQAAAVLAGEQSSGTFVAVPGETEELKSRFAARVEKITPLETVNVSSLPGAKSVSGKFQRAEVVVSWSVENFGFNLPTLVSTIQGNLYELSQFTGLKLMDLELPPSFAKHFRGPKFGVAGTRRLTGVGAPNSDSARFNATSQHADSEIGAPPPPTSTHRHNHQAEHWPDAAANGGAGKNFGRGGN